MYGTLAQTEYTVETRKEHIDEGRRGKEGEEGKGRDGTMEKETDLACSDRGDTGMGSKHWFIVWSLEFEPGI